MRRIVGFNLVKSLAIIAPLAILAPKQALADANLTLNPRLEHISSSEEQLVNRALLKAGLELSEGDFSAAIEGFGEFEFEEENDWAARRSGNDAYLQEAYIDYRFRNFFVRLGRQPVRWSQSWTLPSLDVFTGRRWNRLFFDPVPEQLIHSDGVLATLAGQITTLDVFAAIRPAGNVFPQPFPEGNEYKDDPAYGARLQHKFGGIDTSLVYHWENDINTFGASANYALESVVLKAEGGLTNEHNGFATVGFDVFHGNWTIGPQVTSFHDEFATNDETETLGYFPIRYSDDQWTVELQAYRNFDAGDDFGSILLGHNLTSTIQLSVFGQVYKGAPGRLFGVYEDITNGAVGGLRLEINTAL